MSHDGNNPLGRRGKAAEDDWARKRDAEAIDAMKRKEKGGKEGEKKPSAPGAKGKKSR